MKTLTFAEISQLSVIEIMDRADKGCTKALRIIQFNLFRDTKEAQEERLAKDVWGQNLLSDEHLFA